MHEETLGNDGCLHQLDYGDGFMSINICQNLSGCPVYFLSFYSLCFWLLSSKLLLYFIVSAVPNMQQKARHLEVLEDPPS